ncbi:MAG: HD domain-containing protein [Endomicrobiia bacterium]
MNKINNIMENILNTIAGEIFHGQKLYLVGGAIRDLYLDRLSADFDFVVDRNVLKLSKKIANKFNGKLVILDDVNRIYRIIAKFNDKPYTFDFSAMRGKNILEDLSKRDFTMNAVAEKLPIIDFSKDSFIDPYGGIKDIKDKKIKMVSKEAFLDDPLRLLRAYRFSAELKFSIDEKTKKYIKKHTKLILNSAKERINYELTRIFSTPNSYNTVLEMDKTGLLEYLFSDIKDMKRSSRRFYFHPEGLWQHSKLSLYRLEKILNSPQKFFKEDKLSEKIMQHISSRIPLLKLITLFHDIAKPQSVKKIKGRTRFFGHETLGAQKIKQLLKRLRFSSKDIQIAEKIVKNHMRPGNLCSAKVLTDKAIYRFFNDLGDVSIDLLLIALADRMSYIGISARKKDIFQFNNFVQKLSKKFFEYKEKLEQPKLVDGYVIMEKFNLKPGPLIGKILNIVKENQTIGKISTTKEALKLIEKILPKLLKETDSIKK